MARCAAAAAGRLAPTRMGAGGSNRRRRLDEGVLLVIFVIVIALFVYSMIDAYVVSISERPSAIPFGEST